MCYLSEQVCLVYRAKRFIAFAVHRDWGNKPMSWGIFTRLGATVAAGLMVVGCDSIQGNQSPVFTAVDENAAARSITTEKAITEYFADSKSDEQRKRYRDYVITLRLNAINTNYRVFITELREARAGSGLLADGTTTVLGLLTAVIGGAATKAALGAGTAAVGSAKGAFDKNVFYEKALAAIIAQMDTHRAIVGKSIADGMKLEADDYPLAFALDDLSRLERAGSVESAIAGITETAKASAKTAEDELARTKVFSAADTKLKLAALPKKTDLQALLKDVPNDQIVLIAKADHSAKLPSIWPMLSTERDRVEKARGKPREDPAVARAIVHVWIGNTDAESDLAYWAGLLKK